MKKLVVLFLFSLLFAGCYTAIDKHVLFNADKTEAYELEEVKSVNLFAPTYQYQRAKACKVKKTHVNSENSFGSGYDSYKAVDCQVMTKAMGWNKDLGTPTGPSIMQTGTGIGGAALIQEGLEDSSDSISNVNQQGQTQGQTQKQRVKVRGGCRGNCR